MDYNLRPVSDPVNTLTVILPLNILSTVFRSKIVEKLFIGYEQDNVYNHNRLYALIFHEA